MCSPPEVGEHHWAHTLFGVLPSLEHPPKGTSPTKKPLQDPPFQDLVFYIVHPSVLTGIPLCCWPAFIDKNGCNFLHQFLIMKLKK
jgi:hypothetical protein